MSFESLLFFKAGSARRRTFWPLAAAIVVVLAAPAPRAAQAAASVQVSFSGSASYSDADRRDASAFEAIRAHLQRLGARYLGPRDALTVTVLDLDLAGFDMSGFGPSNLRVLNGVTPPRIKLRYRLTRGRKVVAAGRETLSNAFYMNQPGAASSLDTFKYEKALLDDWFRERFASRGGS